MSDRAYNVPFLRTGNSARFAPGEAWLRDTGAAEGTTRSRLGVA